MNTMDLLLMAPTEGGGGLGSFIPLLLIMVVFYFFMIRPQMKKAKEAKKFREEINKGDNIVTVGGLHGKITDLRETTVIIETESKTKLKIERSAISPEYTQGTGTSELAQGNTKK